MNINTFDTCHLRNDAHFQFYTEVRKLIEDFGPALLLIEVAWSGFLLRYESYDTALKKIVKSALIEKIKEADAETV